MRILVTGAGGFLGGEIVGRLRHRAGFNVMGATRRTPQGGGVAFDLCDHGAIEAALRYARPDVVVHAAGRTTGSETALQRDNAAATKNLVAGMTAVCPAAGLILLGSAAQYGEAEVGRLWREDDPCRPTSAYGAAKLAAEAAAFGEATRSGLNVTSLRLFNIVSTSPEGEQAFAQFLHRASTVISGPKPWRVRMGPLDAVRDFVALDDLLAALERAIDAQTWGKPINICTGVGRPVRELVLAVAERVGVAIDEDPSLGHAGAAWSVGDPARCEARLGFRPSADLSAMVDAAADRLMSEAHARSRA